MTQCIYVTATQRGSGKSTIALGLISQLERSLGRVGYFKPIGHYGNGHETDPDIELIRETFGLKALNERPIPMDRVAEAVANNTLDDVIDEILDAYAHVAESCDFVVCEGTDYFGAMASLEFDINARVAKDLGAPILLVASPDAQASAPNDTLPLLDAVRTVKESLDDKECSVFGVILNRVDPKLHGDIRRDAEAALAAHGIRLLGVVPRSDLLEKPRLDEIAAAIGAEVLSGHERMNVIVQRVLVGAMSLEHALERTLINQPHGVLLVVPGDRDDLLLGLAAAYVSNATPPPAGVVMTGGFEPGKIVKQLILDITGGRMPLMKVSQGTYETTLAVTAVKPQLRASQRTRIDIVKGLVERHVNVDPLVTQSAVGHGARPRLTPKQFLHRVIDRARSDRQHIVLPEGKEERIQRAAERLLARKVVDITLLGNEDEIRSCTARLGLKLDGVQIIDPSRAAQRELFAARYVELRPPAKRPTLEAALEVMGDPTFFGTMMVHEGLASGMVSGSINTTAHTLRPALQFVKTRDDVSIASSVFFMCLPSSVLVYGDCAVNPNPTAEQLADIALASARTAKAFEIEPYVAMLSYSTGDSGAGSDVERVREATRIVRERNPELPVEGPIQYDAAVDPAVARTKLPNSRVAGAATVFIFPDLNAGNNTYKAVQRSAGAIAVGPVMQGLRKPVNDLSRGCTVDDIVNTVAITAIQAQRG